MNPEVGQSVSVIFKNGTQVSGEVVSWSNQISVIESKEKAYRIIIYNTADEVQFIKITFVKSEFERIKEIPKKTQVDIRNIAELKKELNKQELEDIKEKFSSHSINGFGQVAYESINFSKINSPIDISKKEAARTDNTVIKELQGMFSKKD